ncbi:hypothetical protein F0L17_14460 [Streptomyces sp. TRM43335]|uniref:Uncharacterized protein n=1 Tax=Streptomyces taklimakanensis TaxID=2569853 RepID=A0A6G2BDY2_9ACTN|nr:hypothetical protein [Streptomyces taklimakanensis]MTE20289.1 hypothetical protein [Streptomyces taklimakanensis]
MTTLPGHSTAAHRAHGWCSHCPGRTVEEEVIAWRSEENDRHRLTTHHRVAPRPARGVAQRA